MSEVTPYAFSQLLSDLVDRQVTASLVIKASESKLRQVYGIYKVFPSTRALVVKADITVLATLAAALLGLPSETAIERAQETPINEPVRDAMHEILNIASTVLATEGRVVFDKMVFDPIYFEGEAAEVLRSPDLRTNFNVSIGGNVAGLFSILSRF